MAPSLLHGARFLLVLARQLCLTGVRAADAFSQLGRATMSVAVSKPTFPVIHATPTFPLSLRHARASDWMQAAVSGSRAALLTGLSPER